jgi:hypothetical protein
MNQMKMMKELQTRRDKMHRGRSMPQRSKSPGGGRRGGRLRMYAGGEGGGSNTRWAAAALLSLGALGTPL